MSGCSLRRLQSDRKRGNPGRRAGKGFWRRWSHAKGIKHDAAAVEVSHTPGMAQPFMRMAF